MHHRVLARGYPPALHTAHREPLNGSRIAAYALVAVIHLIALGLLARTGVDDAMPRSPDENSWRPTFPDIATHHTQPPPDALSARASAPPPAPIFTRHDRIVRIPPVTAPIATEPTPNAPERAESLSASGSRADGIGTSAASGAGAFGDGGAANAGRGAGSKAGASLLRRLRPIRTPAPEYPSHALEFSEQGVVVLLVKVGVNGRALEASVVKSSGFDDLDTAMRLQVLSEWRFAPATESGHPVEAFTLAEQRFVLNNPM